MINLFSLDPRTKLISVVLMSMLILLKGIPFLIFLTLAVLLLALHNELSFSVFFRTTRSALPFFGVLLLMYLFSGMWMDGLVIVWKFLLLLWVSALLVLTTSSGVLVHALERMLKPILRRHAHNLATLLSVTIRFIPLMAVEAQTVKDAMHARGVSTWKLHHVQVFVLALLRKTFQRVSRLGDAFISRSYTDTGASSYHRIIFSSRDLFVFLFLGVLLWI